MKLPIYASLILITLLFTISCELKRNNPLDAFTPPPMVRNLQATSTPGGVDLTWDMNTGDTDGYFVYRGLAYNAEYARVKIVPVDSITTARVLLTPGYYYFKVSGYKVYTDTLEGSLSKFAEARVN